jgi:hypothetical protein
VANITRVPGCSVSCPVQQFRLTVALFPELPERHSVRCAVFQSKGRLFRCGCDEPLCSSPQTGVSTGICNCTAVEHYALFLYVRIICTAYGWPRFGARYTVPRFKRFPVVDAGMASFTDACYRKRKLSCQYVDHYSLKNYMSVKTIVYL